MENSERTLEEFLEQVRREVDEFEKMWREKNKKDRMNHWPMKMELPNWYEQLTIWLQDDHEHG